MTETHDTSAEAADMVIQGLRPMNGSNEMDAGVAMIEALATRLAEVEAALKRTESNRDAAMENAQEEYERAEAAEAKLAVVREAIHKVVCACRDLESRGIEPGYGIDRYWVLAQLDTDQPALRNEFTESFKATVARYDDLPDGEKADYERARAIYTPGERQAVAERPAPRDGVTVGDEARENIVDEIEEIIGETHDLDATDRRYAENIVGWLERHHPAALRALTEGGE